MSALTYPIVGIPVQPDQPLPLRLEVSTRANNQDIRYQVSLFLRALANTKAKPVEDRLGYSRSQVRLTHNTGCTLQQLIE